MAQDGARGLKLAKTEMLGTKKLSKNEQCSIYTVLITQKNSIYFYNFRLCGLEVKLWPVTPRVLGSNPVEYFLIFFLI